MNGKQLKNSILQWAIQGKLVPQDPNDEPASVLLERIRAEKARLVKEGKIKKDKNESIIYKGDDNSYYEKFPDGKVVCIDEEIPFEIPEGWGWARLRDVVHNHGQKTPSADFCYIDIGSIDNKRQVLSDTENVISPKEAPSRARKIVKEGDVIYSTVRPYLHNVAIIDRSFSHEPIASTGFAVLSCEQSLLNRYLFFFLISPEFDAYANDGDNAKGVAYPAINDEKLYKALVPIPPIYEQQRIIDKIDKLLPFIYKYDKCQESLENINDNIIKLIKKSVLQEAIQGRLVPQNPEDEPAEKLLKRIDAEKQRLVKEGKLKAKDAVASTIFKSDDNKYYEKTGKDIVDITEEIPFDIPDSWSWCRLGALFQHNTGKALNQADQKGKLLTYITTSNLYWDRFELDNLRKMYFTDDEIIKCTVQKGDLLVCEGGDIGRAAIWPFEEPVRIQNHIHRLRSYLPIATRFFYYTIAHYKDSGVIGGKGIGIQGLSSGVLHRLLLPVPPLAEQHRVVEKLDKTLASIMSR